MERTTEGRGNVKRVKSPNSIVIAVSGKQKTPIGSSIKLRRKKMFKIIFWPFKKFLGWLSSGLPSGKKKK